MNRARNTAQLVRSAAGPALALLIIGYFAASAITGSNGLLALGDYRHALGIRSAELRALQSERAQLAHNVRLLDRRRVDPDMADELVRRDLGLARPDEVIIPLP